MARVLRLGFTLAETMLALGLAVVVLLMAVTLALSALRDQQKGSDLEVAHARAGQLLEEFVYTLPGPTSSFWSTGTFGSPYQTDTIQLGNSSFESALFIQDLSTGGPPGMRMITVNVTWGSGTKGLNGSGLQLATLSRLIYAH